MVGFWLGGFESIEIHRFLSGLTWVFLKVSKVSNLAMTMLVTHLWDAEVHVTLFSMVKLSDLQIGDEHLGHELNHLDWMIGCQKS